MPLTALLGTEWAVPVIFSGSLEVERRPIVDRIERLLIANGPFIPPWTDTCWLAIHTTVGGAGQVWEQLDDNLNSAFFAGPVLTG